LQRIMTLSSRHIEDCDCLKYSSTIAQHLVKSLLKFNCFQWEIWKDMCICTLQKMLTTF